MFIRFQGDWSSCNFDWVLLGLSQFCICFPICSCYIHPPPLTFESYDNYPPANTKQGRAYMHGGREGGGPSFEPRGNHGAGRMLRVLCLPLARRSCRSLFRPHFADLVHAVCSSRCVCGVNVRGSFQVLGAAQMRDRTATMQPGFCFDGLGFWGFRRQQRATDWRPNVTKNSTLNRNAIIGDYVAGVSMNRGPSYGHVGHIQARSFKARQGTHLS